MKNLFVSLFVVILFATVTFGQSNTATTTQTGSLNAAFVEQLGSTNTAIILSSGNNNDDHSFITHAFTVPNTSISYPAPMLAKGVTQHGNFNTGLITQSWNYNKAGIAQYGNSDMATINQMDPTVSSTSYRNAWIDQLDGNTNTASIMQVGQVDESYILQKGGLNNAQVTQINVALSDVVQNGSGNHLTQFQSGGGLSPNMNEAYSYQIGNTNYATQSQSGAANKSLITSIGSSNGLLSDAISTLQTGNGNSASIEEGLAGAVNFSLASILQTGSLNNATVSQEGGNLNEARVSQTTDGNIAHVVQSGASNFSTVSQH